MRVVGNRDWGPRQLGSVGDFGAAEVAVHREELWREIHGEDSGVANVEPVKDSLDAFTAELSDAAYQLALRHGLADSWVDLELGLWGAWPQRSGTGARGSHGRYGSRRPQACGTSQSACHADYRQSRRFDGGSAACTNLNELLTRGVCHASESSQPGGPRRLEAREFFETYFGFRCIAAPDRDVLAVLVDESGFLLNLSNFGRATEVEYPGGFHIGFMQESRGARRRDSRTPEVRRIRRQAAQRTTTVPGRSTSAPGGFVVEIAHQYGMNLA